MSTNLTERTLHMALSNIQTKKPSKLQMFYDESKKLETYANVRTK